MAEKIIVLITAATKDEANRIARSLVEDRLAACVNIVHGVQSIFYWEGAIRDEQETLLIAKSRAQHMEKIIERVKSLHSYEVPEIIALPIVAGSRRYLDWVQEMTKR